MTSFVAELVSKARADRVEIALGLGVFLASFFGSAILVAAVVCRLPVDYLRTDGAGRASDGPLIARVLRTVGKNALGVLLVLVGIVLSLPGVPGQGLLTILIGVFLLDLPGKQRFERRLMTRPAVLAAINGVRARFHRAPLMPPDPV